MLLKLCCVVLPLMFLNEVRLVTPANTTAVMTMTPSASAAKMTPSASAAKMTPSASAAKMTPSSSAAKMTANTKSINGTSIQPNNGTVTNSAGTMQHGGSVATTITLMTIASFTMPIICL